MDSGERLAALRRQVARIDRKYRRGPPPLGAPQRPFCREFVADVLSGEIVETPFGTHFETERLFGRYKRHGGFEIADLIDLPEDFLAAVSEGNIARAHPFSWAFLDTETTGLLGASKGGISGAYAFLIGIGSIDREGFRVRQFFLRNYSEEASALAAVSAYLDRFDVLLTYNGKTYDRPLLETRYALRRMPDALSRMQHLDLLHASRRLFKLRLADCRLMNLEREILGVARQGDLPGELIPYCYLEYLRTEIAFRLIPVFHHNAIDILSLACLAGIIPAAFRDPANASVRHGSDLLGLARWLKLAGRLEESLRLMRRAVALGLPDRDLFAALYEIGRIEKKLGLFEAAIATFTDLSLSPNPFRGCAYKEMARHFEHRERNLTRALECVRAAREIADSAALAGRQLRLEARIAWKLQKRHRR